MGVTERRYELQTISGHKNEKQEYVEMEEENV
jgi:hypothetical protein